MVERLKGANWQVERDVDLAKKHNVSRERIRQVRAALHAEECSYKHLNRSTIELINWLGTRHMKLGNKGFSGYTQQQILDMSKTGVSLITGKKYLDDFPCKPSEPTISLATKLANVIDWRLPNAALAAAWDLKPNVVARWRSMNDKPAPEWPMGGRYGNPTHEQALTIIQTLQGETTKSGMLGHPYDEKRMVLILKKLREY